MPSTIRKLPKLPIIAQANTLAPLQPFDASILAGQLAPSSIVMYTRDFAAYINFAGDREAVLDPTTLARWRTHLAQVTDKSPTDVAPTVDPSQEVTSSLMITNALVVADSGVNSVASSGVSVTVMSEEVTSVDITANATPAAMPVTGVGNANSGLAIVMTVAAVLAFLIGLSLWERQGTAI